MSLVVLLLGGGGREAALAARLAQSPELGRLLVLPGNPGTAALPKTTNVGSALARLGSFESLADLCGAERVGLVVVGPEDPLAEGIADYLGDLGFPVFGPTADAARIEASKVYAKELMAAAGIPTARFKVFDRKESKSVASFIKRAPWDATVVKLEGLAAGKGVVVAASRDEAADAAEAMLQAGSSVVVEERLFGLEVSAMAFVDAHGGLALMPLAQDHKRLKDGDGGPNTGGMGTLAPVPFRSETERQETTRAIEDIMRRAVRHMKEKDDAVFTGVLFAGFMLTADGPKVLEFNCRFGDPETQVVLSLIRSDLLPILRAIAAGAAPPPPEWDADAFWTSVVLVAPGYPAKYPKGLPIRGIDSFRCDENQRVYQAGTRVGEGGEIVTNGGRVLNVLARGSTLQESRDKATQLAATISFDGVFYRKDIGERLLRELAHPAPSYASAGVSISEGNRLVQLIKPVCKATKRPGCDTLLGAFGSLIDLRAAGFRDPILVTGTDGVGTKLKIAVELGQLETVGIDLVAMCVNDVLCQGATPLSFLDYYATGKLDAEAAAAVVQGIAAGCRLAGCALSGGETAELPGLLAVGDFDIAGFVVAALERPLTKADYLPQLSRMSAGDALIGLPSSGVHSNGFSLVRSLVAASGLAYADACPWETGLTLGSALLRPTTIYVEPLGPLLREGLLLGLAHITGGGLLENLPRALPDHLAARLNPWEWPAVFRWLAAQGGGVAQAEMLRTFNLGVGMVAIVRRADVHAVLDRLGDGGRFLGCLVERGDGRPQVEVVEELQEFSNGVAATNGHTAPGPKKRVAVFISGSGSNMAALVAAGQAEQSAFEVVLVVSNKPGVGGIAIAQGFGVPVKVIPSSGQTRAEFETILDFLLRSHGVQLVALAGFMRILTPWFVERWRGRLLNIHPSLLPAFKGATAVPDAVAAGATHTGATVHFVEAEVDSGQIVAQSEPLAIRSGETAGQLQDRIKTELEHRLFPNALQLLASGEVEYLGQPRKASPFDNVPLEYL